MEIITVSTLWPFQDEKCNIDSLVYRTESMWEMNVLKISAGAHRKPDCLVLADTLALEQTTEE